MADVPWITLDPDIGTFNANPTATVSIDVTGLPAGEHIGTVTVESPQTTNDPLTLVVTLMIVDSPGFEVRWTIQPPAQLSSGDEFLIEFELIGDFAEADGTLGACLSSTLVEFCRSMEDEVL